MTVRGRRPDFRTRSRGAQDAGGCQRGTPPWHPSPGRPWRSWTHPPLAGAPRACLTHPKRPAPWKAALTPPTSSSPAGRRAVDLRPAGGVQLSRRAKPSSSDLLDRVARGAGAPAAVAEAAVAAGAIVGAPVGEGPGEGPRGPLGHAGYSNDGRLAARVQRADFSAHHAGDITWRWDAAERLSSRVRLMLATRLHPPGRPMRGPGRQGRGAAWGRCLVHQRRRSPHGGAAHAEIHRLGALRRALSPVARMPNVDAIYARPRRSGRASEPKVPPACSPSI